MTRATIRVGSGEATAGEEVSVAVHLSTAGLDIAGVQVDLVPDGALQISALPNGRPDCKVNPDIRKEGYFAFRPPGCRAGVDCREVRGLVLSLSDVNVIPDESQLFTMTMTVNSDTPPGMYRIATSNVGAASPVGTALEVVGVDGAVRVHARTSKVVPTADDSRVQRVPRVIHPLLRIGQRTSDAISVLTEKIRRGEFDVFLSYNREERESVRGIAIELSQRGVLPWFDQFDLRPGVPWQRALEQQIGSIKSAAVFVGPSGIGPWQRQEMDAFLREFVERGAPVIPVLLTGAEKPTLPAFLKNMTWVDFSSSEFDPIEHLLWGITGERTA